MKKETAIERVEKVTLNRATKGYKLVMAALEKGYKFIRPCRTSGRGRYTTNLDYTWQVEQVLREAGIKYTCTNDAPRGSATGNLITLTHMESFSPMYIM